MPTIPSLFRYPGGKTRLRPHILRYVPSNLSVYAEPFVGGGSVMLAVASAHHSATLLVNDLNPLISSFWSVVAGENQRDFDYLSMRVYNTEPTLDLFKLLRKEASVGLPTPVDKAYHALFFNRTTFSGIIDSGPIGGEKQSPLKVDVRWHAKNLHTNLHNARQLLLGRTQVFNEDFSDFIERVPLDAFTYLDPPYFKAGDALYGEDFVFGDARHERLRELLVARRRENWILSYDADPRARTRYAESGFLFDELEHFRSMNSNIVNAKGKSELLIRSDTAAVLTIPPEVASTSQPRMDFHENQ